MHTPHDRASVATHLTRAPSLRSGSHPLPPQERAERVLSEGTENGKAKRCCGERDRARSTSPALLRAGYASRLVIVCADTETAANVTRGQANQQCKNRQYLTHDAPFPMFRPCFGNRMGAGEVPRGQSGGGPRSRAARRGGTTTAPPCFQTKSMASWKGRKHAEGIDDCCTGSCVGRLSRSWRVRYRRK